MISRGLSRLRGQLSVALHDAQRCKVRRSYDVAQRRRIIIATDRLSAFDRQITTVPLKGQVLTQLSRFWFDHTQDICPNHVLAYPDPNVVVCQKLEMLPVEFVVRGYLAGSTATSVLTMYKAGKRQMYGTVFPDGMRDYQELEKPIVTPTTKALAAFHDEPLTHEEIVRKGLLDEKTWDQASTFALALFARGQKIAKENGLILADTKYEFGKTPNGQIVLADEIHTPDSSRYWISATYKERSDAGQMPETLDKDVVRRWLVARCDPYKDEIPPIPDAVRMETALAYLSVFEKITGSQIAFPDPDIDPISRIVTNVTEYLRTQSLSAKLA
ncbi:unnamed protein product [Sphagnum balticum]